MEVMLMAYPKKFLFGANGLFRTQNVTSLCPPGFQPQPEILTSPLLT